MRLDEFFCPAEVVVGICSKAKLAVLLVLVLLYSSFITSGIVGDTAHNNAAFYGDVTVERGLRN